MEWTAWDGSWARGWTGPGEFREVIQIGLLALRDDDPLTETDATQLLVRPTLNPTLSDYITNLTGITQPALDTEAIDLADAVAATTAFVDGAAAVYSFGRDGAVLRENCQKVGVPFDIPSDLFRSAIPAIAAYSGGAPERMMSSRLPELIGFPPPGQAHDALSDCRCIAETFRIMRRHGAFAMKPETVAIADDAPFNRRHDG